MNFKRFDLKIIYTYRSMNLEGIFGLFGFSEDDKEIKKDLEALKETPRFKLGMFHKLITNGLIFKKQVINFFKKSTSELDMDNVDDAGEFMMYSRAYYWIQDCKVRSKTWNGALKECASEEFLCSIKLSIHYFESTEEYEKCAHLKKIQDFIEKNLASG